MSTSPAQAARTLAASPLSVPRATALYIGALFGPGLLLLPGLAAEQAGPASIIAWIALLGLSAIFAATFAALGRALPSAVGAAGYAAAGLGRRAAAMTRWWFLAGVVAGAPIVCLIGASYVTALTGGGPLARAAIAAGLLLAVLGLALGGVRASALAQLLLVALLIAVVVIAVAGSAPAARSANWTPFAPHGWMSVGRAASTLMLSFVGWEAVAPLTGRLRAGQLSRVIGVAFTVTTVLYLGLAVATVTCLGRGANLSVPLADLLQLAVGPVGRAVAAVAALLLTAGSVNAYLSGATEMLRELTAVSGPMSPNEPGRPPRLSSRAFLGGIALAGLVLIAMSALGLADTAVLVSVPTTMFLCVYLSCTASAARILTGRTRAAAAVALLAVLAILAFCGWALLAAAVIAIAAAMLGHGGYPPAEDGRQAAANIFDKLGLAPSGSDNRRVIAAIRYLESRCCNLLPCGCVLSSGDKRARCCRPDHGAADLSEARLTAWGDSDVREHEALLRRARGPVSDLLASKLRRPLVRPGTVRRPSLVERLARRDRGPIVSVVAPPGYGKTTVLAQWAERNGQSFAWVSVDERDNDPKVLLTYVAEALNRIEPIDERVFDALASPGSSVPGSVIPRLGSAFSSMSSPVALVLDDVHTLRNRECQAALSVLADHVPDGSRLAVAGREQPPLRVARLRAEGRILEIGPGDLSLTRDEASLLLRNADVAVGEDEVSELHRRTEGWPAGLYLAALYLREGGPLGTAAVSFGGDDRLVSEYMESEFLTRISRRRRAFLTRTAVLERMSGPLCDAVLEVNGSAGVLADLEQSNVLLVPLDRRGEWYRYHHLFRDMLLAELHRLEPGLMPVLHRRAAQWHERNGQPGEALEYWMKAGEPGPAARLASTLAFPVYQQGRIATAERWFGWLDDHAPGESYPVVAVFAAMMSALNGKPGEAERWAEIAERRTAVASLPDGSPSIEPWLALLRALLCRDGVEQMRADAELAARTMAAGSFWRTAAIVYLAEAHLMAGDADRADALFQDAAAGGAATGATMGACMALAERSLLAIARGAWEVGGQLLSQARSMARDANLEDYPPVTILHAVAARIALHQADRPRAIAELTRAQRLRPGLTYALPHLAVQARIELARCHLALSDFAAAQILLQEVTEVLTRRPGLGAFVGQAGELQAELSQARGSFTPGASALTAAELRLLPVLPTHLSFPEIAEEMFLSPNTVKSQAMSIYRKLGASSRSQAVTRSRELGLLEG